MIEAITARIKLARRGWDSYGSGAFEAPRGGTRKHRGIDFICDAGSAVLAPIDGRITKIGYAYQDDPFYRYVEITSDDMMRHRVFYVLPLRLEIQANVKTGDIIGIAQDIAKRYPKITPHVHYEILRPDASPIDPDQYILSK